MKNNSAFFSATGLSRRDFLTALGIAGGAIIAPKGMLAAISSERKLRIGVVSDVHIDGESGELWKWKKAIKHFNAVGVDAVAVAGDITNWGKIIEFRSFAKAWFNEFPDNTRSDGGKVDHVFILGNHDVWMNPTLRSHYGNDEDKIKESILIYNREKIWKELFNEDYSGFFVKDIKGYKFIGSHWRLNSDRPLVEGGEKCYYEAKELPGYLKEHADELGKTKPFFFVQHLHPKNTCHGKEAWWPDNGHYTTEVLSAFPNAVCFSGHSHKPLTDERAIWQGGFTSFGTCSLSYSSSLYGVGGRSSHGVESDKRGYGRGYVNSGYVIDVHDGFLAVKRLDFNSMRPLGDDWIVPVPVKPEPEFAFAPRAKAKRPPAYKTQPKVEVTPAKNKKGEDILHMSFDAVAQGDKAHSRVYAYEVTMRNRKDTATRVVTVRSPAAEMPFEFEPSKVVSDFKADATYLFESDFFIRPIDCFYNRAEGDKNAPKCIAIFGGNDLISEEAIAERKQWSKQYGVEFDVFVGDENYSDRIKKALNLRKAYHGYVIFSDATKESNKKVYVASVEAFDRIKKWYPNIPAVRGRDRNKIAELLAKI